jgi:hypothetical protein
VSEHFVMAVLALLNVGQLLFWGWQTQTLINKLMCRDLAEYNFIKKGPLPTAPIENDFESEIEESEILNELNGQLGSA